MTQTGTWQSYQTLRSEREAHWFIGARVDATSYIYTLADTQQQAEGIGAGWLTDGYSRVQITIPEWIESVEGDQDETPIPVGYDQWGVAELTEAGARPAHEVESELQWNRLR